MNYEKPPFNILLSLGVWDNGIKVVNRLCLLPTYMQSSSSKINDKNINIFPSEEEDYGEYS